MQLKCNKKEWIRVHTRRGGVSFTFSSLLAARIFVSSLFRTGLTCSEQEVLIEENNRWGINMLKKVTFVSLHQDLYPGNVHQ